MHLPWAAIVNSGPQAEPYYRLSLILAVAGTEWMIFITTAIQSPSTQKTLWLEKRSPLFVHALQKSQSWSCGFAVQRVTISERRVDYLKQWNKHGTDFLPKSIAFSIIALKSAASIIPIKDHSLWPALWQLWWKGKLIVNLAMDTEPRCQNRYQISIL